MKNIVRNYTEVFFSDPFLLLVYSWEGNTLPKRLLWKEKVILHTGAIARTRQCILADFKSSNDKQRRVSLISQSVAGPNKIINENSYFPRNDPTRHCS